MVVLSHPPGFICLLIKNPITELDGGHNRVQHDWMLCVFEGAFTFGVPLRRSFCFWLLLFPVEGVMEFKGSLHLPFFNYTFTSQRLGNWYDILYIYLYYVLKSWVVVGKLDSSPDLPNHLWEERGPRVYGSSGHHLAAVQQLKYNSTVGLLCSSQ